MADRRTERLALCQPGLWRPSVLEGISNLALCLLVRQANLPPTY
jgi:hypothetical protein